MPVFGLMKIVILMTMMTTNYGLASKTRLNIWMCCHFHLVLYTDISQINLTVGHNQRLIQLLFIVLPPKPSNEFNWNYYNLICTIVCAIYIHKMFMHYMLWIHVIFLYRSGTWVHCNACPAVIYGPNRHCPMGHSYIFQSKITTIIFYSVAALASKLTSIFISFFIRSIFIILLLFFVVIPYN